MVQAGAKRREADSPPPPHAPHAAPFIHCNLPPHAEVIAFDSAAAFESHYQEQHAHRCTAPLEAHAPRAAGLAAMRRARETVPRCNKTFPSAHFLALHGEECHSALAHERQARGEKIFGCFEPVCGRLFATPKTRRQHLVQVHHYPPQFFFSVTNHGIGELRKRYGATASLVRKPWRPRSEQSGVDGPEPVDSEPEPEEPSGDVPQVQGDADESPGEGQASHATSQVPRDVAHTAPVPDRKRARSLEPEAEEAPPSDAASSTPALDALTQQMSSLSFVPRAVRRP